VTIGGLCEKFLEAKVWGVDTAIGLVKLWSETVHPNLISSLPPPRSRPAWFVAGRHLAGDWGRWESSVTRSDEPRSNLAVGIEWASRVTTVGLMFVVPPLLGHLVDRGMGTNSVGLLTGAVLGFAVGMIAILRIAREGTGGSPGAGGPRRG
jgi:hypothetical protein